MSEPLDVQIVKVDDSSHPWQLQIDGPEIADRHHCRTRNEAVALLCRLAGRSLGEVLDLRHQTTTQHTPSTECASRDHCQWLAEQVPNLDTEIAEMAAEKQAVRRLAAEMARRFSAGLLDGRRPVDGWERQMLRVVDGLPIAQETDDG